MPDALGVLLQDLHKLPKYKWEEVYRFGVRWRDDADPVAREALVHSILPLAVHRAKHYQRYGADLTDLISLAMEGVLDAVDRYDPDRSRLTTYAVWHIDQRMRHFLAQDKHVIHVPGHCTSASSSSEACVAAANVVRQGILSLDQRADTNHADRRNLLDKLLDPSPGPADELADREADPRRVYLWRLIDLLSEQSRAVILGRLRGDTLTVVGQSIGVTRERVRQIEQRARMELKILAEEHPPGSFAPIPNHRTPMPFNTDSRTNLSPLDVDQFDLSRVLDTLDIRVINDAIAKREADFEQAKTLYHNKLKSLSILKKAVEARNGHADDRRLASDATAHVGPHRKGGRQSHCNKILLFLCARGPSSNKRIMVETGILGSSVSATLITHGDLFVKKEDKWELTGKGLAQAASLQESAGQSSLKPESGPVAREPFVRGVVQ